MYNGNRYHSNSFNPDYEPEELTVEANEQEDLDYVAKQAWKRDAPARALRQAIEARKGEYLYLRQKKGLTHARAVQAADPEGYFYKNRVNMPPKKSYAKKAPYTKGVARKTTTTAKSGTRSNPIDLTKLVKAATERAMAKTIETQHSNARFSLEDRTVVVQNPQTGLPSNELVYRPSGIQMSALNMDSNLEFKGRQIFAFNLSALSQVRGSTTSGAASGWRQGYKINVQSISVDVRIALTTPNVDCRYLLWVVRKKDGIRTNFHTPQLVDIDESQLFRKKYGGPFSVDEFDMEYPTTDKKNTEVWSWPEGMRDEKSVSAAPRTGVSKTINLGFYKRLDSVWEFSTDNPGSAPALKDGDYNMFLIREGPVESSPKSKIDINIDLAFKDS